MIPPKQLKLPYHPELQIRSQEPLFYAEIEKLFPKANREKS